MPWIRKKRSDSAEKAAILGLIVGFTLYLAFAAAIVYASVYEQPIRASNIF